MNLYFGIILDETLKTTDCGDTFIQYAKGLELLNTTFMAIIKMFPFSTHLNYAQPVLSDRKKKER